MSGGMGGDTAGGGRAGIKVKYQWSKKTLTTRVKN